jgi:glutaredoxin 3
LPDVVIYTRPWCGFCRRAKALLDAKSVRYDEIDVGLDPDLEREMIRKAGGRTTVPQIFIGERHIGGSDDLVALDRQGKLDELLQEQRPD